MSNNKQPSYNEAVQEIETIVEQLENNEADLDTLAEKVKRALTLLNFCSQRLRAVEDEIAQMQEEAE